MERCTMTNAVRSWDAVRECRPLVFQMTNGVVMNEAAHVTLAIGAAPIMSSHPGEAAELARLADAVVVNIGTPDDGALEASSQALVVAQEQGKISLLDPVGYGASALRTTMVQRLLAEHRFSMVKGNGGEMGLLGGTGGLVRGVDAVAATDGPGAVKAVARRWETVAISTGEIDVLSDGTTLVTVQGGHALLTTLTGTGCWLGALCAAAAAASGDPLVGAAAALAALGVAAERAAVRSAGPGSFRVALFDEIAAVRGEDLATPGRIRFETPWTC